MSKASEFATHRAAISRPEIELGDGCSVEVTDDGAMVVEHNCDLFTIRPKNALALAAWINATFGETAHE